MVTLIHNTIKLWRKRNKRESTKSQKFWARNGRCKEKTWTWYVPTWSLYVILKRHETHLSGRNPRKAQTIFYFIVPTYIMRDTSTSTTASTLCHYHYCWILYEYISVCIGVYVCANVLYGYECWVPAPCYAHNSRSICNWNLKRSPLKQQ